MNEILRNGPTVCAVEDRYCIIVPVKCPAIMSVSVGGKYYYNHANGIRISDTPIQKFTVPMEVLDKEKRYTIHCKKVIERLAYSCEYGEEYDIEYSFKPLQKTDGINIYHLSDTHGMYEFAVNAGSFFGNDLDLLILNGDIAPDSESENAIFLNYDIAYGITKGEIPCIISRGNHDLRGAFAEKLDLFLPSDNGRAYYRVNFKGVTFTLVDCGEDKVDGHIEYSDTVCCHEFRLEQDRYLKSIYTPGYTPESKFRILLSHIPFCHANLTPDLKETEFSIEDDLYTDWCRLMNTTFKPHFFLAGHIHKTDVYLPDSFYNNRGIACPVVAGGRPERENGKDVSFNGAAITLYKDRADVKFTDNEGNIFLNKQIIFPEE